MGRNRQATPFIGKKAGLSRAEALRDSRAEIVRSRIAQATHGEHGEGLPQPSLALDNLLPKVVPTVSGQPIGLYEGTALPSGRPIELRVGLRELLAALPEPLAGPPVPPKVGPTVLGQPIGLYEGTALPFRRPIELRVRLRELLAAPPELLAGPPEPLTTEFWEYWEFWDS